MTDVLLSFLQVSILVVVLAIGLDARFSDLTYLWKRPGLLLRSLIAMHVLAPVTALTLVWLLPLPSGIEIGLLVLAVSAGAPLLPRRLIHLGRSEYVISLVLISTVVAIFVLPIWLTAIVAKFGTAATIELGRIALILTASFFLPLVTGMFLRRLFPRVSGRGSDLLARIGGAAMGLSIVALLGMHWEIAAQAHLVGISTVAVFAIAALVYGHLLGGPAYDDRTALAVACATRHVGIVVLAAATIPGPRVPVLVAVYIIPAVVLSIPYLRWRNPRLSNTTG